MDGHTGIKNEKVNNHTSASFRATLSALSQDEDAVTFVIHVVPTSWTLSGLRPEEFLQRIGYEHFQRGCPFENGGPCLWRPLTTLRRNPFLDSDHVDRVHHAFQTHAQRLPDLYSGMKNLLSMITLPGTDDIDLFPQLRQLPVPVLQPLPGALPDWVAKEMPAKFAELRDQSISLNEAFGRMRSVACLLWEQGDPLEDAVRDAFRDLGYEADRTAKAKTYDVLVKIGEGRRLLVEVGGMNGALKKDSTKIGQALQALQQEAGPGDHIVLAINAHREKPVAERSSLEPVSPEALALITGLRVSLITTADFFGLWKLAQTALDAARSRIQDLHAHEGGRFMVTT